MFSSYLYTIFSPNKSSLKPVESLWLRLNELTLSFEENSNSDHLIQK